MLMPFANVLSSFLYAFQKSSVNAPSVAISQERLCVLYSEDAKYEGLQTLQDLDTNECTLEKAIDMAIHRNLVTCPEK